MPRGWAGDLRPERGGCRAMVHEPVAGTIMETIIGEFSETSRAHQAIDALLERKYEPSDIGLLAIDEFGETTLTEARPSSATSGALGLLLGIGSMAIPGVGPLIAAGPLTVGLAGTTAGAAQEDAARPNPLARFGVPEPRARAYSEALRRGGALVLIRTNEAMSTNIAAILEDGGAVTVERYLGDSQA